MDKGKGGSGHARGGSSDSLFVSPSPEHDLENADIVSPWSMPPNPETPRGIILTENEEGSQSESTHDSIRTNNPWNGPSSNSRNPSRQRHVHNNQPASKLLRNEPAALLRRAFKPARAQTDVGPNVQPGSSMATGHRHGVGQSPIQPVTPRYPASGRTNTSSGALPSSPTTTSPPAASTPLVGYSDESSDDEITTPGLAAPLSDKGTVPHSIHSALAPSPTPPVVTESARMSPPTRRNAAPPSKVKEMNRKSVPEKKRPRTSPGSSPNRAQKRAKPSPGPRTGPFLADSSDDEPVERVKSGTTAKPARPTLRGSLNFDQLRAMITPKKDNGAAAATTEESGQSAKAISPLPNSTGHDNPKDVLPSSQGLQKRTNTSNLRQQSKTGGRSTPTAVGNAKPLPRDTSSPAPTPVRTNVSAGTQYSHTAPPGGMKRDAPREMASGQSPERSAGRQMAKAKPREKVNLTGSAPVAKMIPDTVGSSQPSKSKASTQLRPDTPREILHPTGSAPVAKMLPDNVKPSPLPRGKANTGTDATSGAVGRTDSSLDKRQSQAEARPPLRKDKQTSVSQTAGVTHRGAVAVEAKRVTEQPWYASDNTEDKSPRSPSSAKASGKSSSGQRTSPGVQQKLPGPRKVSFMPSGIDLFGDDEDNSITQERAGNTSTPKPKASRQSSSGQPVAVAQGATKVQKPSVVERSSGVIEAPIVSSRAPTKVSQTPKKTGQQPQPATERASNRAVSVKPAVKGPPGNPINASVETPVARKRAVQGPQSTSETAKPAPVGKIAEGQRNVPAGNAGSPKKYVQQTRTTSESATSGEFARNLTGRQPTQPSTGAPMSLDAFARKLTQSTQPSQSPRLQTEDTEPVASQGSSDPIKHAQQGKNMPTKESATPKELVHKCQSAWGQSRPVKSGNKPNDPQERKDTAMARSESTKNIANPTQSTPGASTPKTGAGVLAGNRPITNQLTQESKKGMPSRDVSKKPVTPAQASQESATTNTSKPVNSPNIQKSAVSSTPARSTKEAPVQVSETPNKPAHHPGPIADVAPTVLNRPTQIPKDGPGKSLEKTKQATQPLQSSQEVQPPKNTVHEPRNTQNAENAKLSKPVNVPKHSNTVKPLTVAKPLEQAEKSTATKVAGPDDGIQSQSSDTLMRNLFDEPAPPVKSTDRNKAVALSGADKATKVPTDEDSIMQDVLDASTSSSEPTAQQKQQQQQRYRTQALADDQIASNAPAVQHAAQIPASQPTDVLGPAHFTYTIHQKHYTELDDPALMPSSPLIPAPHTDLTSTNALALQLFESTAQYASAYAIKYEKRYQRRDENDCVQCCSVYLTGDEAGAGKKNYHIIWVERNTVVPHKSFVPDKQTPLLNKTLYMIRLCRRVERATPDTSDNSDGSDGEDSEDRLEHSREPSRNRTPRKELHYEPLDTPEMRRHGVFTQVYTARNLANRAAMQLQIALSLPKDPQKAMDKMWQQRETKALWEEMLKLDGWKIPSMEHGIEEDGDGDMDGEGDTEKSEERRRGGCWDSKFNGLGGVKWKLWVERVGVFGPRNV